MSHATVSEIVYYQDLGHWLPLTITFLWDQHSMKSITNFNGYHNGENKQFRKKYPRSSITQTSTWNAWRENPPAKSIKKASQTSPKFKMMPLTGCFINQVFCGLSLHPHGTGSYSTAFLNEWHNYGIWTCYTHWNITKTAGDCTARTFCKSPACAVLHDRACWFILCIPHTSWDISTGYPGIR